VKRAYGAVIDDIEHTRADPVPLHLRNAVTGLMASLGYGRDYKYAHDRPDHFAPDETFLPEALAGRRYYEPTDQGMEARIKARVEELRRRVADARDRAHPDG
jgi:putative ATPase